MPVPIPHTTGPALTCAATDCTNRYTQAGWHHVKGCDPNTDRHHQILVSVFVCTKHLTEAEHDMTKHMSQHADRAWTVETHRMYGWDDDGRGAHYTAAHGDPTEQGAEQMALF